ncbi:MAG: transglycosylase [Rhizobacter sp.]|nr:transglycosylase [Rhizobacter sp.]
MVHHTINISTAMAPKASSNKSVIASVFLNGRSKAATRVVASAALILGVLGGCASAPDVPEPASAPATIARPSAAERPAPAAAPVTITREGVMLRPRSRWVPAEWRELPGWEQDKIADAWGSLLRSCERPAAGWASLCKDAQKLPAGNEPLLRWWMQDRLQPYRVESVDGATDGLATGYFEPLIEATRLPTATYSIALYTLPTDLTTRKPYWTRQQLDSLPVAQQSLRGRELAYVSDPLDALVLQVQGTGRLRLREPDGSVRLLRVALAGHNDQPYKSVGRWLIEQGELKAEQASWPAIKAWARINPQRVSEMLWSNPRVVFFKEEPLPDPELGPRGAQGVPLTPGRSIAVDRDSIPYGTPVWLDTTEPLRTTPLRRLVMAQDTGTAITGAVRADYFWGWGDEAEQQAGRMKQNLRLWALWPKS